MSKRRAVIIENFDQLERFKVRDERGNSKSIFRLSYIDTWVTNGTGFDHGRKFHESKERLYDVIIKFKLNMNDFDLEAGNIFVEDGYDLTVRNLTCFDFESTGKLNVKGLYARNVKAKEIKIRDGNCLTRNITCEKLETNERIKVHEHIEATELLSSLRNIEAGSILAKNLTFRDFCIATKGDILYENFTPIHIYEYKGPGGPYKGGQIGLLASVWGETKKVDYII